MTLRSSLRPNRANPAELVLNRLKRVTELTAQEEALVAAAGAQRQAHPAAVELYGEGHMNRRPRVILSGWACRQRELSDGRRQIFGFLLPGDAVGLCQRRFDMGRATTMTLTQMETADAAVVAQAMQAAPGGGLDTGFCIGAALEDAFLLDHLMRVGRQTAYERTAHLLLEFHWRLALVGMTDGWRYHMPLTQEVLADALGLSVVHMNRTLQQLRREGRVRMHASEVELLQPQALVAASDFKAPSVQLTPPNPGRAAAAAASR